MTLSAIIAGTIRVLGLPAVLGLGLLAFYEGIPGAHKIPYLASIPVIGNLTTGRVHSYAAEQVALEKAKCNARIENMVSEAEHKALQAVLERERAFREMSDRLTRAAQDRAVAAAIERDKAVTDLEARIAADTGEGCEWTEEDELWRKQ